MKQSNHPIGDSSTQVSRVFRLDQTNTATPSAVRQYLEPQPSVIAVEETAKPDSVRVTYDVLRVDAKAVADLLVAAGATLRVSRWQKIRIAWFAQLDGNQRDNARHHPACCSKPPPTAGRRH